MVWEPVNRFYDIIANLTKILIQLKFLKASQSIKTTNLGRIATFLLILREPHISDTTLVGEKLQELIIYDPLQLMK